MREHPGRKSTRLPGFDYTSTGAYFVTVCAYQREMLFEDDKVAEVIQKAWHHIPTHFEHAYTDAFVVMPNHVHGIIWVARERDGVGAQHAAPLRQGAFVAPGSLGAIVRSFKSAVTRELRLRSLHGASPIWQRNYYDRIIRNDEELNRIREYIVANPMMWHHDAENPMPITNEDYEDRWAWLERPVP